MKHRCLFFGGGGVGWGDSGRSNGFGYRWPEHRRQEPEITDAANRKEMDVPLCDVLPVIIMALPEPWWALRNARTMTR